MQCRILHGDCREVLRDLLAESVHCVVTSPPYWGLRSYGGDPGMIGLEPTFDEHLENLVAVFREVRRVLRDDGTLWLNYGDAYAANTKGVGGTNPGTHGVHQVTNPGSYIDGGFKLNHGLKPKDLMMMPARVAMALQADGWYLRSKIIWAKPNPMPESVTDRPTSAYEELFLMTKSGSSLFWTHRAYDGVRSQPAPDYVWRNRDTGEETPVEPSGWRETPSEKDPKQKLWRRVNLWEGHDYFYDAEAVRTPISESTIERYGDDPASAWKEQTFTDVKKGRSPGKLREITGQYAKPYEGQGGKDFTETGAQDARSTKSRIVEGVRNGTITGANLRNVWTIPTHSYKDAHFATFPPALVEPCIKAGTSERGVCGECGAPWARDVETSGSGGNKGCNASIPPGAKNPVGYARLGGGAYIASRETVGWSPTCEHKAATVPAVCLDPFAGSGTVGQVALSHGRSFIGVEINPEYVEMGKRRTESAAPLFTEIVDDEAD